MFDLHASEDKTSGAVTYDYYVVGIRPCDRNYYIEHYTGVPKGSFDGAADSKSIATQTGMVTKNWNGSAWADREGDFINGISLMDAPVDGSFETTVKIIKVEEGDAKYYNIYIGKATNPISCKSVDNNANKGGVAAYSCIYKGKSIAGTMTLDADSLKGSLNLEVAEAE
ncbi:MAG: hypothetical protein HDR38_06465 [Treponema sp.]|nr:hypothetical protein [Treponema sp.]